MERIGQAARAEIAASERAAALELRAAAARLATEQAAALVRERMNNATEQGFSVPSSAKSRGARREVGRPIITRTRWPTWPSSKTRVAQVRKELADFLGLMRESPDLDLLLNSPAVQRANKRAVMEALMAQMGASQHAAQFSLRGRGSRGARGCCRRCKRPSTSDWTSGKGSCGPRFPRRTTWPIRKRRSFAARSSD